MELVQGWGLWYMWPVFQNVYQDTCFSSDDILVVIVIVDTDMSFPNFTLAVKFIPGSNCRHHWLTSIISSVTFQMHIHKCTCIVPFHVTKTYCQYSHIKYIRTKPKLAIYCTMVTSNNPLHTNSLQNSNMTTAYR